MIFASASLPTGGVPMSFAAAGLAMSSNSHEGHGDVWLKVSWWSDTLPLHGVNSGRSISPSSPMTKTVLGTRAPPKLGAALTKILNVDEVVESPSPSVSLRVTSYSPGCVGMPEMVV